MEKPDQDTRSDAAGSSTDYDKLLTQAKTEAAAEYSRAEIEKIESLDIDVSIRVELVEIELGLKPATDIVFTTHPTEHGQEPAEINLNGYEDLIAFLEQSELRFSVLPDVTKRWEDHDLEQRQRIVVVAKTEEALRKVREAIAADDHRLYGEAYGFPETAIEAFDSGEALDDPSRAEIFASEPELEAFASFALSRDHWQEELEGIRHRAKAVKEVSPKLFDRLASETGIARENTRRLLGENS